MFPGVLHGKPEDQSLEKQIEKQMGCMAGFLQMFDRHQILAGKRLYSTKRLPVSQAADSTTSSEISVSSPVLAPEHHPQLRQHQSPFSVQNASTSPEIRSVLPEIPAQVEIATRMPIPLPVFESKDGLRSSWKLREGPRLSLDSRAIVDGKGSLYPREIRTNTTIFSSNRRQDSPESTNTEENDKNRRSPSVVARLMGLEGLPDSCREPMKKAELRRSASESRVSRDLRFIDGNNFQLKQPQQLTSGNIRFSNVTLENAISDERSKARSTDVMEYCSKIPKCQPPKASNGGLPWNHHQQRKSFFDSQDFFPEPKRNGSLYGEIEKRLKMRGVDEPAKDLETLKQILEALQLKGLLHSRKPEQQTGRRNFIYDRQEEAPIVVMRPARSPVNRTGRAGSESPPSNSRYRAGISQNLVTETLPPVRRLRDRQEMNRNLQNERRGRNSSPNESNAKSPSSVARRKPPLSIETHRKGKDVGERRTSPGHSPRIGQKKTGSDLSRSPSNRKQTTEISPRERISCSREDESCSVSESSVSMSSQIDIELQERSRMEDHKQGRSLLERCDKLLHSIAEITAVSEQQQQPSPVSVLDSSFYKDDSSPSPPVTKRCIRFRGSADQPVHVEDEHWSPASSPVRLALEEGSDDHDFQYVSEILRASQPQENPNNSDVFSLLEKHIYSKCKTNSSSKLHRRLVFDTVGEIVEGKLNISPWKAFSPSPAIIVDGKPFLRQIWLEFSRIKVTAPGEDVRDVICGILVRDMAGDGWGDRSVDTSEAVLDIERLIFKDLVAETIRDLAAFAGKISLTVSRRKLVF